MADTAAYASIDEYRTLDQLLLSSWRPHGSRL